MAGIYKIEIGSVFNEKEAEASINKFIKTSSKTIKINAKVDGAKDIKEVNTYTNKFGQSIKTVDGIITNVNTNFNKLNKEASDLTIVGKDVNTTFKSISREIENTSKTSNGITTLKTYITDTNIEGQKLYTHITKTIDAFGNASETIKVYNQQNKVLSEELPIVNSSEKKLNDELDRTSDNALRASSSLKETTSSAKSLGQTFGDVVAKVAKFYIASLPIRAVQTAITESVEIIKDYDEALIEFNKVTNLSGVELDAYTAKLAKLGETTARTRTEMLEASASFRKMGYSDEESAKLAQTATLFQNVADEEMTASEASAILISQMKAFGNNTAEFAEKINDTTNEIANNFAVSSGDIAKGMQQASASLSTFGNDYEETLALLTAGTEIFQGKSQQVKSCCLLNIA